MLMWGISISNSKGVIGYKSSNNNSSLSVPLAVCLSPFLRPPALSPSHPLWFLLPWFSVPGFQMRTQLSALCCNARCQGHSAKQWTGPLIIAFLQCLRRLWARDMPLPCKKAVSIERFGFWSNTISLLSLEYLGG